MYLKVKSKDPAVLDVQDLGNGQLYVDTDGDVNLIVRDICRDENVCVCFNDSQVIIMDDQPEIQRLVTFKEVVNSDE